MHRKQLGVILLGFALLASAGLIAQESITTSSQEPSPAPKPSMNQLTLTSVAHPPIVLSSTDLKSLPHITATIHNTHTNADETYSGVRLADLLVKVDAPLNSELRGKALAYYIVATGTDGYKAALALAEVDPGFHPGEVIVGRRDGCQAARRPFGPVQIGGHRR
ncbi:MAG: hypothetical protein WAN03_19580 [Candidatus Sulfotelmatobacter sp.]